MPRDVYYVYIMANWSRSVYVGSTSDLVRRVYQHRSRYQAGFTSRYRLDKLVYYEHFRDARDAVARERQIKGWVRARKLQLNHAMNPYWQDLSAGWFDDR